MSLSELRKVLKEKKVIFGTSVTLKNLKRGKASKVFLASNCPDDIKKEIKSYNVEVIELKIASDELTMICKRSHPISVLSC